MKLLSIALLCSLLALIPAALEANVRLTDDSASSQRPVVAIDAFGSSVIVVWQDNREGNFEIYWRGVRNLPKPEIISIEPDSADVRSIAAEGVRGGGGSLPHLATIQAAAVPGGRSRSPATAGSTTA